MTIPSGLQVVIFFILLFTMGEFGNLIYGASIGLTVGKEAIESIDGSDPRIILSHALFFQISAFLMTFIIMLRITGQRFHDLVFFNRTNWKWIGLTILIFLGAMAVMPFLEMVNAPLSEILPSGALEKEFLTDQMQERLVFQDNFVQFIFVILIMGVLPAICEELIFRGFLIGKIMESGGNENLAIGISAAIFALTHFQPLKFLPMFFFGLCLGYVYVKFRNIKYAMLMHFLINGVQITIGFLVGSGVINIDV